MKPALTLAILLFVALPSHAVDRAAKPSLFSRASCLLKSLRRLEPPLPPVPPVNWQKADVYSRMGLPSSYVDLVERSPLTKQLRVKYGQGKDLEFAIDSFSVYVEQGLMPIVNGYSAQALYLKQLITTVFPEARIQGVVGPLRKDKAPRKTVRLDLSESSQLDAPIDWRRAGVFGESLGIQMHSLKAANPGLNLRSRGELRQLLNLRQDANVLSIYGSLKSPPSLIKKNLDEIVKKTDFDTIVVTTMHRTEIGDYVKTLNANIQVVDSDTVVPTPAGTKTVIINRSLGKLPAIHGAADRVLVIGSPNIAEPINAGVPMVVSRNAEDGYNQAVWSNQIKVVQSTGGIHAASSIDEAVAFLKKPNLAKPSLKTYEVIDRDGTNAIDRLLTNVVNVMDR